MLSALMLILLAGAMNGSFATPMKRVRGWEWEHTWLAWSFVSMIVIPLVVAVFTIPRLRTVYHMAGSQPLLRTAFYGMLWGASAVLFGLGVTRVGLALGFGIILGTASSLGAIIPFLKLHRDRFFTAVGLMIILGTAVVLAGLAAFSRAGLLREAGQPHRRGSFMGGRVICVLSGLGTTFMSVALNEAVPIYAAAVRDFRSEAGGWRVKKIIPYLVMLTSLAVVSCMAATGDTQICKWKSCKVAAFSIGGDDSLRSQTTFAIPLMTQRGIYGTWWVNTGRGHSELGFDFIDDEAYWVAAIKAGHDLANHAASHRCSRRSRCRMGDRRKCAPDLGNPA